MSRVGDGGCDPEGELLLQTGTLQVRQPRNRYAPRETRIACLAILSSDHLLHDREG